MYTNDELRDMDKGALVCLVGVLQDNAERYRFARDDMGTMDLRELLCAAPAHWDAHIDRLRQITDQDLTARTLDALQC